LKRKGRIAPAHLLCAYVDIFTIFIRYYIHLWQSEKQNRN